MKKIIFALAAVAVFSLGIFVATSHAEGMTTKGWDGHEVSQLLYYSVRNNEGQFLGRIEDFVTDSNGRIALAIISQPGILGIRGKAVAVPFEVLSFGSKKREFVLDMSREKFALAPRFDRKGDQGNSTWAEDVYRYYGIEPYWTEGGGGSTMEYMRPGQHMDKSPFYSPFYDYSDHH